MDIDSSSVVVLAEPVDLGAPPYQALPIRYITAALGFARKKPLGAFGALVLIGLTALAIAAPWVTPYNYDQVDFRARLEGSSWEHWMGTDNLGRDVATRVVFGLRVSFIVSAVATMLVLVLGTVLAMVTTFYGGWIDTGLQRIVDAWMALPALIILISVLGVAGPSALTIVVALVAVFWPGTSRIIRSAALSELHRDYIVAARAIGAKDSRIMLAHMLPNIMHIVLYSGSVNLGQVMLAVTTLGFLGFGVPPPHPELGAMLSGEGLQFMRRAPHLALWPGVAITLAVFAFGVLGDAVRDVADPRLRGR